MNNIFEGAKFGDKFLTRDGRIVIYWGYKISTGRDITWHYLISDSVNVALYCTEDGLAVGNHTDFPEWDEDIVSRYQEPIDEDKLDELATNHCMNSGYAGINDNDYINDESLTWGYIMDDIRRAYKAGYRQAKEE